LISRFFKYIFFGGIILSLVSIIFSSNAGINDFFGGFIIPEDSNNYSDDTIKEVKLQYPIPSRSENPLDRQDNSPLFGSDPNNMSTEIIYDPETGEYKFVRKVDDEIIGTPYSMDFDDYMQYDFEKAMQSYWRQRTRGDVLENRGPLIPELKFGGELFDKIFGSNTVSITPQGSAEISLGLKHSIQKNPALPKRNQRVTSFSFDENIDMSVVGQVGDKMKIDVKYNTDASFDFQNTMKLEYTGQEDDIIQKLEAGNVSLPLTGTLITGSQSLFGFKTEAKFGRLTATAIFSQKKSESSTINVEGGAMTRDFEISVDEYEANKHFFISHYFRENYDRALENLPVISSGINISRIEVWITNRNGRYENSRNIVALMDLGESNDDNIQSDYVRDANGIKITRPPDNEINNLGEIIKVFPEIRDINMVNSSLMSINMTGGIEYEKIESAYLLQPSEFTFNDKLGYISLNTALAPDQVLAVAFEYTINGEVRRVGEFSNSAIDAPQALIVKLLKGTSLTPSYKNWNLMMKNIYYLRTYQMSSEDFWLDIMYTNEKTGTEINFLPAGAIDSIRLLNVLHLDNLNGQLDPYPDGIFDYMEGITVNSQNGRIIFPVVEPFGSYLRKKIVGNNPANEKIADEYVFQELYDSTQNRAQQIAEKNKYKLRGKYKSAGGSEISLNALDIPQGSVKVTAGAQELVEGQDYSVDYNLGRVKIINQGILESGTPIQISLESNSMFNTITRTLIGTHLNYEFSKDLNIGATILNMSEKPLTYKVGIGEEPMSNTIWGVNASYRIDAPFITKAIDFLPFIETKEMSTLTMTGEFAHLIPGHSRAIKKEGNAYIDDFEGSKITLDMKSLHGWTLASTPTDSVMFPEGRSVNDLKYGYNRAKIAWYNVKADFYESNSPISTDLMSSHYVRQVFEKEIFPNKENANGNYPAPIQVFDVVYYPHDKGPYNYNVQGMNPNGKLKNPESKWGGIMRKSTSTTDFEDANIEYIEFWLMDPFVEDQNNQGGDLFFNLGDISEDILKDGRKSFEHGLPTPQNDYPVDTTAWGVVPKIQSITSSFSNDPIERSAQDVGLDGLNDEAEKLFFSSNGYHNFLDSVEMVHGINSEAYRKAYEDPSNDNFKYYMSSDYDVNRDGILERYKYFNGLERNSLPAGETNESAYSTPDVEDINGDNTLNESENYFQYKVSVRREDLEVGRNYITDKITAKVTMANDQDSEVSWYQFRIPISEYEKKVGSIRDFKSIRFMRMFMTNFSAERTVLRFATLNFVRGEWRKYNTSFMEPGEYIPNELSDTPFETGAVNIEENSNKIPVNYVLPPGITREQNPMSPQLKQLNEQSMSLKVLNLQDGDGRAVYKNINLDIRKYLRMRMFIHAEAAPGYGDLKDNELNLFIRLGTDYKNNYYEYEIPLKVTPEGRYDGSDDEESPDRYAVWPSENDLDLYLEVLQNVKQTRNDRIREGDQNVSISKLFSMVDGNRKASVMGNPNLANVKTIMIGIRNPKNDGEPKSGEIWVNELRLSNFDEKGGWAANARITAKLADLGTLSIAGSTSKPGFGAINQKIGELQKEEINRYDISTNLELGKLFPERFNVRIPLYMSISENVINPEYNPLDPDIPFKVTLNDPNLTKEYKDSVRKMGQDYTRRKSINLNNVKVNKMTGEAKIYDLANWSFSYGFNEVFRRDVNTVSNLTRNYTGALFYNYNATPKIVEPFKNVKAFSKKAFQILRDVNFYYLPSQISFRTNINRLYGETQLRNIYNPEVPLPINVRKDFTWIRQFDFKYNITKALRLEFSSTNNARIDEMEGRMDKSDPDLYQQMRDTIWESIRNFGRNVNYHHQWDVSYTLPINKISIFNWITANVRYVGTYDWNAAPKMPENSGIVLGNTVENSKNMNLSTQFNLQTLYTKVKYFDQINRAYRGRQQARGRQQPKKEMETVKYESSGVNLKAGTSKNINHNLKTEDVTVKVTTEQGVAVNGETIVIDKNRVKFTSEENVNNVSIVVTGEREKKDNPVKIIIDNTLLLAMSVRNISINYSERGSTFLPGYLAEPAFLGTGKYTPSETMFGVQKTIFAPTVPFLLGWQDEDFGWWAVRNNLLSKDTTSIQQFMFAEDKQWNVRAQIEPLRDFKIDLEVQHMIRNTKNSYFRYNQYNSSSLDNRVEDLFDELNPVISGSFSMTVITIGTAFEPIPKTGNISSEWFKKFSENRIIIAERLARERSELDNNYDPNAIENGFPVGYGQTSLDVLVPAFFAAYTGIDAEKVNLKTIPSVFSALPNWRITYNGLTQKPFFSKYFRTISISHRYRSSYNINSYQTRYEDEFMPIIADGEETDFGNGIDEAGNFFSKYIINGISIAEEFMPLISADVTMINSLIAKVELRKKRTLNMSFANNQLTESKENAVTIGTGYRFKEVPITIKSRGGRQHNYKSDLNVRLDFTFRDNMTVIRKLEEGIDQITIGSKNVSIKASADYVLNSRFSVRLFYDHTINNPKISNQFYTANINFGFTLKFILAA
jgi:cell surface protein SprA